MDKNLSKKMLFFLSNDIGLELSLIELAIKLSKKNNISLPIILWSYSILTIEEIDKLYSFLFHNE